MLSAKELRIGNIFWDDYGGYNIVTSINCNKVGEAPNTVCAKHIRGGAVGNFSCNDIKAIPLTHDVLEMLGFEKDKYDVLKHHILKCRWITEKITGDKIDVPFLRFDSIIKPPMPCVDIYYLHQLQNLYKALTGKDLKFKTT